MKKACNKISWFIMMASLVYIILFRFCNPDMTDTRAFLETWWLVPVIIVGMLAFLWSLEDRDYRR